MTDLPIHGILTIGPYLGYHGRAEYNPEDDDFHGEVIGTRDVITFVGKTPAEVQAEFRASVDDYLEFCKSLEREPEKPFSGRFLVRIEPALHRELSARAEKTGTSLNQFVSDALEQAVYIENEPSKVTATMSEASSNSNNIEESVDSNILSFERLALRLPTKSDTQSNTAFQN